jgi:hypothetical protein
MLLERGTHKQSIEVHCSGCGHTTLAPLSWSKVKTSRGTAVDPIAGLPLWLQTPCCGEIFWAYNEHHLQFLKEYVGASLREREPNKNNSLASRLPLWMKQAKHRDEVLRCVARLERLLLEH